MCWLIRVCHWHHALLLVGMVKLGLLFLRGATVAEPVLVLTVVEVAADADHGCTEIRVAVTAELLHVVW